MDHGKFLFMRDCLRDFNYPHIHALSDAEILDIFSQENKQFLVSWLLKNINSDFSPHLEEIAEILYCGGFCSKNNMHQFMSGGCNGIEEFQILYKMFRHMKDVCSGRLITEPLEFSMQSLHDVAKFDTNMFPMYGPKQTLTAEERAKKIEEYRQEMETLTNLLESSQLETVDPIPDMSLKHELATATTNLQANFPSFQKAAFDMIQCKDNAGTEQIQFKNNFSEVVEKCSSQVTTMLQFLQDMKVLEDFEKSNLGSFKEFDNKKYMDMMHKVSELCTAITTLKKL